VLDPDSPADKDTPRRWRFSDLLKTSVCVPAGRSRDRDANFDPTRKGALEDKFVLSFSDIDHVRLTWEWTTTDRNAVTTFYAE
jgi:hypothetical protein